MPPFYFPFFSYGVDMVEGDSVSTLGFTDIVDIRVLVVYLSSLVFFQMLWTSKWNECYTETAATSPSLKIDYSPAFFGCSAEFRALGVGTVLRTFGTVAAREEKRETRFLT